MGYKQTSFIRWAGGKSWLVPIFSELTKGLEYQQFIEPFMGGASIFFSLEQPHPSFLSDINEELVNAFCAVKDNPQRVIQYLKCMVPSEENYYKIRSEKPKGKYQRAARFIYLNKYSYNGIYRVNKLGEYNVPYGFRENIQIQYDRILSASEKLQIATISCDDYQKCRSIIEKNDLVFLDPPYAVPKEAPNQFVKYNQKLFSITDQEKLCDLVEYINSRDAYYILSNAYHPAIKDIFGSRCRIITPERLNVIGGKNAKRGIIKEYVFTNIPERTDL